MPDTNPPPPQAMLPHGIGGWIFGALMERLAARNYRWVIAQLAPRAPSRYLEIGFGTGKLAASVAREIKPAIICAVDPSPLMLRTTRRRLKRFEKDMEIDLRLGDEKQLPWADYSFDAIVASHSFQFWGDPTETIGRLRKLIAPSGQLILVIRQHKAGSAEWIPNPITRSADELGAMRAALESTGFSVVRDEKLFTGSQGIACECA